LYGPSNPAEANNYTGVENVSQAEWDKSGNRIVAPTFATSAAVLPDVTLVLFRCRSKALKRFLRFFLLRQRPRSAQIPPGRIRLKVGFVDFIPQRALQRARGVRRWLLPVTPAGVIANSHRCSASGLLAILQPQRLGGFQDQMWWFL